METGEFFPKSTNSKEWAFLTEGAAHMIYRNTNTNEDNILQDNLCVLEKANTGGYKPENSEINELFVKLHNQYFQSTPKFGSFLTKCYGVSLEGENKKEFVDEMMKISEGKRRADRVGLIADENSAIHIEKNLFYMSPSLREEFKVKKAKVFFVEIKPKNCCDEIPEFEEIKGYIDQHPLGKEINAEEFYSKYFKDCMPSERKYVYRKLIAEKHKIFNEFNTADFYSNNDLIRSFAIENLLREDWGYQKVFDENVQVIPHNEIEKFFQEWDPSMNIHTIAEIISRSVDWDLVEMLKGLQCLFPFTPDKLKGILENFDGEKDRELMKANLERILKVLAKIWREHGSADFTKLSENAELKDIIDYLPLAAFLLSCTSRDSSFLIRVAITHNKNDNLQLFEKKQGYIHKIHIGC